MRKLDLADFQVVQKVRGGDGSIIETSTPYPVKDSLLNIMFLPTLGLQGAEAVKQQVLAHRILQTDGEIMLEEEEYERVSNAVSKFSVTSIHDATLINRILNQTPEIT